MPELRRRFRKKIREIEESTEKLSTLTIDNYKESIELFHNYNDEQYKIIEENTNRIVKESKEIYSMSVKILAMEQPVATDLKFVANTIKIANHLKRIGKLSFNMAEIANEIEIEKIPKKPLDSMDQMAQEVENMLNRSIRSYLTKNPEEAAELEEDDDIVDDLFDEFLVTVTKAMKEDTSTINTLVPFLLIARYLERIADRSESIGGRVLLMQKYHTK